MSLVSPSFLDRFKTDIGIDLGTANSLVYLSGDGIVINEPTVIAINKTTGQVIEIGEMAKRMIGRTPMHVEVIRPLIGGVISDFDMTQEILRYFLKKVKKESLFKYVRTVIAVPTNLTEVERKSVEDAVILAGASDTHLLEEPVAAAAGAGLLINDPTASMIVDIGGGTTEIAVVSMGGVVVSESLKTAGDKMNEDIIKFVHSDFKMFIGEQTAENIKIELGSAIPMDKNKSINIYGRDASTGLPKEIAIKNMHIRMAIEPTLKKIIDVIKDTIERTPPELSGDILKNGIYISGGGGMLRGFDKLVKKEVGINANMVDNPLTCVANGTGVAVENLDRFGELFSASKSPIYLD